MRIITVELTDREREIIMTLLDNEQVNLRESAENENEPKIYGGSVLAGLILRDAVEEIDRLIKKLESPAKVFVDTAKEV